MGTLNKMSFLLAAGLAVAGWDEESYRKAGIGKGLPRQHKNGSNRTGAAALKRASKKRRNLRARSSKRA